MYRNIRSTYNLGETSNRRIDCANGCRGKLDIGEVGAGFLGALLVKILDIVSQEWRMGSARCRAVIRFINENLDPVLNSADELVGKLGSLADSDFKTLRRSTLLE